MSDLAEQPTDEDMLVFSELRARRALEKAPDVVAYARSIAIGGQLERGETLPEWTAPMRITAADDADELFSQLVDWATNWADVLEAPAPSVLRMIWLNRAAGVQGFKAGTSPQGAHALTRTISMWLALRHDAILSQSAAGVYFENVADIVGALRARYPMAPKPPRRASHRPCPVCGEFEVMGRVGADPRDSVVRCEHCGHVVEWVSLGDLDRWLRTQSDEGMK
jgi:predicted RNA-binding Zn-ribbon protein involved in translation (DUF1610 family)